jgi:NADP-dependent 3-hydroxy acid dehydrogenase YdfG
MSSSKDFNDKVVLVTGSNSGIGEATIILFAKLGAKCVVTGRDELKILEVAKKCEELSPLKLKVFRYKVF